MSSRPHLLSMLDRSADRPVPCLEQISRSTRSPLVSGTGALPVDSPMDHSYPQPNAVSSSQPRNGDGTAETKIMIPWTPARPNGRYSIVTALCRGMWRRRDATCGRIGQISAWMLSAPYSPSPAGRGWGEQKQPSFRRPGIGAPQAPHQHGEHLHGDLWTAL